MYKRQDYLLCFDLLNKDSVAFAGDYRDFAAKKFPSRFYAEGLLIYLAGKKASLDEVEKWNIPPQVLDEFGDYTRPVSYTHLDVYKRQPSNGKTWLRSLKVCELEYDSEGRIITIDGGGK